MVEQQSPQDGNVAQKRDLDGVEEAGEGLRKHLPHQGLPDEAGDAGAQDGDGETRDHLVGPHGDGQQGEDQGAEGPASRCRGHGQNGRLAVMPHQKAHDGADKHQPLDTQVQVAGLLRQDLPQGGE